ncbi:hypothetical protein Cgig2_028428 [Carnegiea gigantea]|uniref:Uncharacterized protein n=1 Tax=Carnegiea gigantea TaxID=171969 RepID=A0A9Q1GII3_9CARY|nr:hypothetical protein Cgig2_028428 [Carnegiea gigantea]
MCHSRADVRGASRRGHVGARELRSVRLCWRAPCSSGEPSTLDPLQGMIQGRGKPWTDDGFLRCMPREGSLDPNEMIFRSMPPWGVGWTLRAGAVVHPRRVAVRTRLGLWPLAVLRDAEHCAGIASTPWMQDAPSSVLRWKRTTVVRVLTPR